MIEILIKRLSKEVSLPKYETSGSSGMDLAANIDDKITIDPGKTVIIPTGLSLSIPKTPPEKELSFRALIIEPPIRPTPTTRIFLKFIEELIGLRQG